MGRVLNKNFWPCVRTLLRNPFSTEAAFTDNVRGMRIVFSKITVQKEVQVKRLRVVSFVSQNSVEQVRASKSFYYVVIVAKKLFAQKLANLNNCANLGRGNLQYSGQDCLSVPQCQMETCQPASRTSKHPEPTSPRWNLKEMTCTISQNAWKSDTCLLFSDVRFMISPRVTSYPFTSHTTCQLVMTLKPNTRNAPIIEKLFCCLFSCFFFIFFIIFFELLFFK